MPFKNSYLKSFFLLLLISCQENEIFYAPGAEKFANLRTEQFEKSQFSTLVIGDWGKNAEDQQVSVAASMAFLSTEIKANWVIACGDNFYEFGVKSTSDEHWKKSFEDVYNASSLNIPWYVVLGNHDYRGNPEAQIDYTLLSNKWKMPARYYDLHQKINDSINAHFIFLDTSPLTIDPIEKLLSSKQENPEIEYHWLDSVLTSSKDKWKIVVGHHPIYSSGEHGNNQALISNLLPLFKKHQVNLYLTGHDHDLQFLEKDNISLVVSGAAAKLQTNGKSPEAQFSASIAGSVTMQILDKECLLQYYSDQNKLLFQKIIKVE